MSEARHPELAVVTAHDVRLARSAQAPCVLVVGRGGRRALRTGWPVVRRMVALPGSREPHLIMPVDRRRVAAYALRTWAAGDSRLRRMRNEIAAAGMSIGRFPDLPRSLTLGLPSADAPFLVEAARPLGVPRHSDWFLTLGWLGDPLARAAFQLFAPAEAEPSWVLKFSRVPGNADPFDRDERGLSLAAHAGRGVAAHAPRLLGRFEAEGLQASVEEAAVGQRLTHLLQTPGQRADKVRAVDQVASWIIEVGRQTAAPPSALSSERARLVNEVLPLWRHAGVPGDLVARVPAVPAVIQHNDLGCWNIVTGRRGFVAVDWESARPAGFPLWDLVYFLVDALIHLDGEWAPRRREVHAAKLLRGEVSSSATLFAWIRAAVESLEIPPSAVGPITTLSWMHHGLSKDARQAAAHALDVSQASARTYGDWMAQLWLREPGLGPQWEAWSG